MGVVVLLLCRRSAGCQHGSDAGAIVSVVLCGASVPLPKDFCSRSLASRRLVALEDDAETEITLA